MKTPRNKNKQSGAVLAVALIIMLVLTLLVLSTSEGVVIQEKMTAAVRDSSISLAVAESATVEAEQFIENQTTPPAFGSSGGLFGNGHSSPDLFGKDTWKAANSVKASTTIENVEARYFIEDIGLIKGLEEDLTGVNLMGYGQTGGGDEVNAFKIVARATGRSGNAERVVLSYYGKRF